MQGRLPGECRYGNVQSRVLSHYYKGRVRPLRAYAFGLIHLWARLAQISPRFVNLVNHAPITSDLAKRLLGVSPQRKLPEFAVENFKSWFVRRQKTLNPQCSTRHKSACFCGRTHSTIIFIPKRPRRPWLCWNTPASRWSCR